VFSALGALLSDVRHDYVLTAVGPVEGLRLDAFAGLEAQAGRDLAAEGLDLAHAVLRWSADLRYIGQNYEINVAVNRGDDAAALRRRFEERHQALYSYIAGESVELVNLRLTAVVSTPPIPLRPAVASTVARPVEARRVFLDGGWMEIAVFLRSSLMPEQVVTGPALVEEEGTTTLVGVGEKASLDPAGLLTVAV
jgi:N-methylhydantoinase A